MKSEGKRETKTNTVYYLSDPDTRTKDMALKKIIAITGIDGLTVKSVKLNDQTHSSDEGNESCIAELPLKLSVLRSELKCRCIDSISITGSYEGKPAVIGYSFEKGLYYITARNSNPLNAEKLIKKIG